MINAERIKENNEKIINAVYETEIEYQREFDKEEISLLDHIERTIDSEIIKRANNGIAGTHDSIIVIDIDLLNIDKLSYIRRKKILDIIFKKYSDYGWAIAKHRTFNTIILCIKTS